MAVNKPRGKKIRLGHALNVNGNVPVWVIAKTGGKFRRNYKKRNFRRSARLKA
ncbi:50S ribosomal protein L39e [Candidatus Marsarchaeota G2 archaeon ECH_B_SAG-F08]|jgi:large subunit ribosomal protein L39e|uniref:Large ribosomal subunit protein eL39 n=6 Tax=Candidatus Marsarchaeota TaxID=1978152 RepID=A0A2R6AKC1_9ARCH|nr:MAG: 50S ribosomal protein L39e [Candidatus Marsarchaeota G1 archaeon OSP_D]PSN86808.1 MAG: 50S ribosomal protein L39e [Candidatus Marsarchaeota G1 archaeon BE_D]PSN88037.1 MAG: 50S ribosomal protein L39e [Candidatus Marsarchaeota G1 archaeon OSP_C]PSN89014.1 MAG: 50S ribosomal protein L39e [Candidatus Marsarchaeota G1 archaeon OSP_B]PSN97231.1 MAG: 50S ribosomal protein L39e [Candidatus Marsarchaeota G2 archaeon ECH_B_SAG-F08]PSO05948.1 MAG: 50S ribosomal protein L39e [Candidatus Marsarcha